MTQQLAATSNNQVLIANGSSYEFANIQYSDIEGTPLTPSSLVDLSIVDGQQGEVLTANGSGSFEFKKMNYSDLEDTPEDNSFINSIIFG